MNRTVTLVFYLIAWNGNSKIKTLKSVKIVDSELVKEDWVVLTHELLRTPRTPTNSYKLPNFTKTRTPKNNIF